jgi:hypothetical protein
VGSNPVKPKSQLANCAREIGSRNNVNSPLPLSKLAGKKSPI